MSEYIKEPKKIPLFLRLGIWIAERKIKKPVIAARLLAWYPKAALGSGIMESLVAHEEGAVTKRLLQLIRMQVSIKASCPFCIDMNSNAYEENNITNEEIESLQGLKPIEEVTSFAKTERIALNYTNSLTMTPISIDSALVNQLVETFTEREVVVIVSTIAQVNFWTRILQGFGIAPEGFTKNCAILKLENYSTRRKNDV